MSQPGLSDKEVSAPLFAAGATLEGRGDGASFVHLRRHALFSMRGSSGWWITLPGFVEIHLLTDARVDEVGA